jgi:hypothetical protein
MRQSPDIAEGVRHYRKFPSKVNRKRAHPTDLSLFFRPMLKSCLVARYEAQYKQRHVKKQVSK